MHLNKDFQEFIELLNLNKVEYLLVGGYAVAYYGYPRYTKDIDIWINTTAKNGDKIMQALIDFGFKINSIQKKDFVKEGNVIQIGYPPRRINLLTGIDGVVFDECFKNRKKIIIDEIEVNIISLEDLIKNKRASNRYQDLADLENIDE